MNNMQEGKKDGSFYWKLKTVLSIE